MSNLGYFANEIKRSLDFRAATEYYGVEYHNGKARCPFHTEKTGSFAIKNNYGTCYGCGWHGDIVDFVKSYFSLDFKGAITKLNEDFRLGLEIDKPLSRDDKKRIAQERKRIEAEQAEKSAQKAEDLMQIVRLIRQFAFIEKVLAKPITDLSDLTPDVVWALKEKDKINYLMDERGL